MALTLVRGNPRLDRVQAVIVVGGSTRTSTIPGISIAGPSPEGTLYTPTLDLEYLVTGRPITLPVVPVSPEGLPTPALISRALVGMTGASLLVVDSGTAHGIKAPHVTIPSAVMGGRIDEGSGLPRGAAERIIGEARMLGENLARGLSGVMIGETIPGGTTTAAAIMEALVGVGVESVSSSSNRNPKDLKRKVIGKAVDRAGRCSDAYCKIDEVGDPVHPAIAGIAAGAVDAGIEVVLAGGTQMGAVLAILDAIGIDTSRITVATTRWILEDSSSDMVGIVDRFKAGLVAADISFSDAPWSGLRMYEEGYVKEGVAAGGMMTLTLARGAPPSEVKEAIYKEYRRLLSLVPKDR